MFNSIDRALAFDSKMLSLRGYRQQILASNIANADTPHYVAAVGLTAQINLCLLRAA